MTEPAMKDLSKIKAGDTLILRNGGREVCTLVTGDGDICAGLLSWDKESGNHFYQLESGFDIIDYEPAPEKREFTEWVVWCKSNVSEAITASSCSSKENAEKTNSCVGWTIIAITPVTFKEGDGL